MTKEEILELLEEIRSNGKIKDAWLSAYINMKLNLDEIDDMYQLLEKDNKDNMIILLRSIMKQYLRNHRINKLKLDKLEEIVNEKGFKEDFLIKLFRLTIEQKKEKVFIEVCDVWYEV